MAAGLWQKAIDLGKKALERIPAELHHSLECNLVDLSRLYRRSMAYAYHLRETNLAEILQAHPAAPERIWDELRTSLQADLEGYQAEQQAELDAHRLGMVELAVTNPMPDWIELKAAIDVFDRDRATFLVNYFDEAPAIIEKGLFSVTSR